MNLYHKNIKLCFLVCLSLVLTMPVIYPGLRLFYFVPFLIIMYYQKPLPQCLWASLLCGVIMDLLSPYSRMGLNAMNFSFTTCILYRQRENFFPDSLSTLPLMTFFFSIISTLIQAALLFAFEQSPNLVPTLTWAWNDLILMPIADGAYAFILFILPFAIFGKPRKKGEDYFTEN